MTSKITNSRVLLLRTRASDVPEKNIAPVNSTSRLSLRSNFSWMLIGNAVYAGCQWGVLALFARLGTESIVGQFVLAIAVTAPIMSFFMMQLRMVQATDSRREFRFGDYLALRIATLAGALITTALVCWIAGYQNETLWMIFAIALLSSADGLSDTAYGLLQQHERLHAIAVSMILRGVFGLSAIALIMILTHQPLTAILSGAFVRFLIFLGFDLRNVQSSFDGETGSLVPVWKWKTLTSLTAVAAPLGIVMALIVLNGNISRYFVKQYFDQSALGIYGAIAYMPVFGTMIVGALGESIAPRLARTFSKDEKSEFLQLFVWLILIGLGIGAGGIVCSLVVGKQVLWFLYGPAYAHHSDLLVWIMLSAAFGYVASFSGYAITAARLFRLQIPLFAVVTLTNALACEWLIPSMGLRGAACSLLVATLVQFTGTLLILRYGISVSSTSRIVSIESSFRNDQETA